MNSQPSQDASKSLLPGYLERFNLDELELSQLHVEGQSFIDQCVFLIFFF